MGKGSDDSSHYEVVLMYFYVVYFKKGLVLQITGSLGTGKRR